MANLFLLFNHSLTARQAGQAVLELEIDKIHEPDPKISRLWANIPPESERIMDFLKPVFVWIDNRVSAKDFVLIQGDFGACYLMIQHVKRIGAIPVYSTTERQATEKQLNDGSVQLTHSFQHVRFRIYGQ